MGYAFLALILSFKRIANPTERVTSLLPRLFLELIDDVQETISRQDVGVSLCAALCVDGAGDIGKLVKDVEAVEHDNPLALEYGTSQACVPNDIIGIEARVSITRATIKREVSGKVELPRKMHDSVCSNAILPSRDVLERRAVARVAVPCNIRREAEGVLAKRKTQFGRERKGGGTHDTFG